MLDKASIVTINAGATATLRIKVKSFIDELENTIVTPSSLRGYTIYLHMLDEQGDRKWSCKLDDRKWDNSEKLFKVELTNKDTLKLAGCTVHFEASMVDSDGHVIISDLIEIPNILLRFNENSIGPWMAKEL